MLKKEDGAQERDEMHRTSAMAVAFSEFPRGFNVFLIRCLAVPLHRLSIVNLLTMTTSEAKPKSELCLQIEDEEVQLARRSKSYRN